MRMDVCSIALVLGSFVVELHPLSRILEGGKLVSFNLQI